MKKTIEDLWLVTPQIQNWEHATQTSNDSIDYTRTRLDGIEMILWCRARGEIVLLP